MRKNAKEMKEIPTEDILHDGVPARHHLQPSSPYASKYTEAGLKKQQRIPIATDGSNPSNKNKWRDLQALHNWAKKSETFQLKQFWLNKFLRKSFELHAWSEPSQAQVQCGSKQVWYNMATICSLQSHFRVYKQLPISHKHDIGPSGSWSDMDAWANF